MVHSQALSAVDPGKRNSCTCGGRCSRCAANTASSRALVVPPALSAPPTAQSAGRGFAFGSLAIKPGGSAGGASLRGAQPTATPRIVAREAAGPGGVAAIGMPALRGLSAPGPAGPRQVPTPTSILPSGGLFIDRPDFHAERPDHAAALQAEPATGHASGGSGAIAAGITPGIGARSGAWMTEPSDRAEQEASHVAEHLFPPAVQMAGVVASARDAASPQSQSSRSQASTPASCPSCGTLGRAFGGHADSGTRLPPAALAEMEGAFGADFSAVRIHTNSSAAQLSRNLKARAFTYGNEIFFDHGQYDPSTARGKRLLAHELTHTLQQRDAIASLARDGESPSTLKCVNDNLSAAGVASWLIGIVGAACGLLFGLAGSPSGPGAAGTAALGAATCIAGVTGFAIGAVLGIISGCWKDPNFKSRGAYLSANTPDAGSAPGGAASAPTAAA